jgi:hypothetical protein
MELLLRIAACENFLACSRDPKLLHPCREVVDSQRVYFSPQDPKFQPPEPWRGHLNLAPLLFISSNPSIAPPAVAGGDTYPNSPWTDSDRIDYFANSFGGGTHEWIRDGVRHLLPDGSYGKPVAFWAAVKRRAEELYSRSVEPGTDYALTEVVHCKSLREIGVREAVNECTNRYLGPVLALSPARVVVVLGVVAGSAVRRWLVENDRQSESSMQKCVEGPPTPSGLSRMFVFAPHPNAFKPKRLVNVLRADELALLREVLKQRDLTNAAPRKRHTSAITTDST